MGAWIEIHEMASLILNVRVAPLVGAWIEIFVYFGSPQAISPVAPLVGAWIEIQCNSSNRERHTAVAPLVGAWIEIKKWEKCKIS